MLDQTLFDRELDRVYATFNKAVPGTRFKSALWDAVADTDNLFFASACAEIRLLSRLPDNLPAWFAGRWNEWRASRRTTQEDERTKCPEDCENGWHTLYSTEAPMAPFAYKCVCNTDSRFSDLRGFTRRELDQLKNRSWEDPFRTRAARDAWLAAKSAREGG